MAETLKFDARLAEGIAYFEQMRDIMPEDRTTLEFLVVAYAQLGEKEKGESALARLAKLLIETGDLAALEALIPRLENTSDSQAQAILLRAKALTAPKPDLTPEVPKEKTESERIVEEKGNAVESEQALIDMLLSEGVITESEHHTVTEHLKATPLDDRVFLISALQILEKENSTVYEKVASALADKFSTPPIPFGVYEIRLEMIKKFPSEIMRLHGIVPFTQMGSVTLVALLNPADEAIRKVAVEVFGNCQFYLCDPIVLEKWLEERFSEVPKESA